MLKKIMLFVFFITALSAYPEDAVKNVPSDSGDIRETTNYFMKFRGQVGLLVAPYFDLHRGMSNVMHIANINYTPIDYTDKGDPTNKHHFLSDKGRLLGNGEGKLDGALFAEYNLIAPFLKTNNFLFSDNNIKITFNGDVSPVSIQAGMKLTVTPIAFLTLSSGFMLGTGWMVDGLGNGLAFNDKGTFRAFYGPVMQMFFASTLQFDVAALMSGKSKRWTHIVMQCTPKIQYLGVLNMPENKAFQYQNDDGENFNGWKFYLDALVGYQIPVIEDDKGESRTFIKLNNRNFMITLGFNFMIDYLDLSHYYDSTMKSNGWGSDFVNVKFGPLINLDLPYNLFLALIFHFRNDREYTSDTVGNLYFADRKYKDWYVNFYRIIVATGWNF